MTSLIQICEALHNQFASNKIATIQRQLQQNSNVIEEDDFFYNVGNALHGLLSASAAYTVYGDFDKAVTILYEFHFARESLLSKIPQDTIDQHQDDIQYYQNINTDSYRSAINENRGILSGLIALIGEDKEYQEVSIVPDDQQQAINEMPEKLEKFRQIVSKYTGRLRNVTHREDLVDYLTRGTVMGLIRIKLEDNQVPSKSEGKRAMGVSLNEYSMPWMRGLSAFDENSYVRMYSHGALDAMQYYGSCPEGEYIQSLDVKDRETADMIGQFSISLGKQAALFAQKARRKGVEAADVQKAYDVVFDIMANKEPGILARVHQGYKEI